MKLLLTLMALAGLSGCRSSGGALRLVTFQGAEAPLIAQKQGMFTNAGLTVEIQETPGTAKAMEALLGGSADVIAGTFDQAVQLQAKGQNVVAFRLLTECHCLAIVVPPSKKIQSLAELGGKVVGVGAPGGAMQNFASFLIARAGGGEASYAGIGVGATAFAAIEGGKVDAAVVLATTLERVRQRYPDVRVLAETFSVRGSQEAFGFSRYPGMALMARDEWLKANHDTAQKVSDVFGQAVDWLLTHTPEQVAQELGAAADLAALRLHLPRYSASGVIDDGPAMFVAGQLERAGTIPRSSPVHRAYTNYFVKRK